MLTSPWLPLQGQRESAYVFITAEELRLRKQTKQKDKQARQTTLQHFQQLDPHSPPPDVDPGTLEKRREKVTKLSWEESELAKRSLHRSRAAH